MNECQSINITIRNSANNEDIQLSVKEMDNVEELKKKIHNINRGYKPILQKLIYYGRILNNSDLVKIL